MPAVLSQWRQHRAYRREAQAQPLQVPESSLEELLVKGRFGYTRVEDRKARRASQAETCRWRHNAEWGLYELSAKSPALDDHPFHRVEIAFFLFI